MGLGCKQCTCWGHDRCGLEGMVGARFEGLIDAFGICRGIYCKVFKGVRIRKYAYRWVKQGLGLFEVRLRIGL